MNPDRWAILKIDVPEEEVIFYKVIAGFSATSLDKASWAIGSAIVSATKHNFEFEFVGETSTKWQCKIGGYGLSATTLPPYTEIAYSAKEQGADITVMPEETDWENFDWSGART